MPPIRDLPAEILAAIARIKWVQPDALTLQNVRPLPGHTFPQHRAAVRSALRELEAAGRVRHSNRCYGLPR